MQVHEASMPTGKRPDRVVHAPQVCTREPRVDAEEIALVVAEGRIVYIAHKHRTDGQRPQKALEGRLERPQAGALIGSQSAEKIVAADRKQRDRLAGRPQATRLPNKRCDAAPSAAR